MISICFAESPHDSGLQPIGSRAVTGYTGTVRGRHAARTIRAVAALSIGFMVKPLWLRLTQTAMRGRRDAWARPDSVGDCERHRVVEIDHLLLAPRMENSPKPVLVVRSATMLHNDLCQIGNLTRIHSQATVGRGGPEALDIAGAVDVVVGILEENLHDFHRIARIAGTLRGLALRPLGVGRRAPTRIPNNFANGESANRRWISVLTDRDRVGLERAVPAPNDENSCPKVCLEREGSFHLCSRDHGGVATGRRCSSWQLDLGRSSACSQSAGQKERR